MSGSITASVVLCTRDRADRLLLALEALAAMRTAPGLEWECIVVDNASCDATRRVIEDFIAAGHPRFRYAHEPRGGKTYALNTGIVLARGEFLVFTDDDALVAEDWLQATVSAFHEFAADGVGGKVLPLWQAPVPDWLGQDLWNVLALLDFGDRPFQLDWRSGPRMLYGVNYAFRREVFTRLGEYDTTLGSRGEDQELFDRLAASNARVFYDPRIVVRHMISPDRLTRGYYRDWYRATGLARARLPAAGRQVLGIPLYTLRQGVQAGLGLLGAALTFNRAGIFRAQLRCSYFLNYYRGRLKGRPAGAPA